MTMYTIKCMKRKSKAKSKLHDLAVLIEDAYRLRNKLPDGSISESFIQQIKDQRNRLADEIGINKRLK